MGRADGPDPGAGWWRPAAVAVLTAAVLLAGAPGALAHTRLDLADPAAGSRLEETPASVDLVFAEAVEPGGARVSVVDSTGRDLVTAVHVGGPSVSADLAAGAAGTHHLTFRVTGRDGHAVEGDWTFEVVPPVLPAAVPAAVPAATAGRPDPSPAPPLPTRTSPQPVTAASPGTADAAGASGSTAQRWAFAAVVAMLVLLGGLLVRTAGRWSAARARRHG